MIASAVERKPSFTTWHASASASAFHHLGEMVEEDARPRAKKAPSGAPGYASAVEVRRRRRSGRSPSRSRAAARAGSSSRRAPGVWKRRQTSNSWMHDVEDRAAGEREERRRERRADPRLPDRRCRRTSGRRRSARAARGTPSSARSSSPDIGPTMPKPSVALCRPNPMIRTSASAISPAAADWPIARPSPKLCRPIPVAISSASRRPGVSARPGAGRELVDGGGAGADRARARRRFIHSS